MSAEIMMKSKRSALEDLKKAMLKLAYAEKEESPEEEMEESPEEQALEDKLGLEAHEKEALSPDDEGLAEDKKNFMQGIRPKKKVSMLVVLKGKEPAQGMKGKMKKHV